MTSVVVVVDNFLKIKFVVVTKIDDGQIQFRFKDLSNGIDLSEGPDVVD